MKHNLKVTFILLTMFLLTQFIGIYIIHQYTPIPGQIEVNGTIVNITIIPEIPYGMEPPTGFSPFEVILNLIIAFVFAISLIFLLMRFKAETIIKLWFFIVVILALGIAINSFIIQLDYSAIIAFFIAVPLAVFKIFKRNIIIHNLTEFLIYPGISVIFVSILAGLTGIWGLWLIILLLLLISGYDIYAVWHSNIMKKLAKYQIEKVKVFSGFFLPYMDKKERKKYKKLKQKYKKLDEKNPKHKKAVKNAKIKINLAILGGGDIVFPIITAGVLYRLFGLIPALFVILGATAGLTYLLFFSEKAKFYPAMPFISTGIFIGMILSWLITLI